MKERPIPMSADSVKASLDGRKTQTRRVIIPHPVDNITIRKIDPDNFATGKFLPHGIFSPIKTIKCPYGQAGDRLWVRETWRIVGKDSGRTALEIQYKEDMARRWIIVSLADFNKYTCDTGWGVDSKWRPSIFMPRWASRILLEITEIRVERLQEITEEETIAEGVDYMPPWAVGVFGYNRFQTFLRYWDSLNAKRGYGWDKNPWVWVISFRVVKND